MSVWVYKDGEGSLIPPERLSAHLDNGYTLYKDAPTKEEADANESGKLSTEEIRAAAKEAGIEGWDKKRISTLKKALGYE
jgi:hypothetical protein